MDDLHLLEQYRRKLGNLEHGEEKKEIYLVLIGSIMAGYPEL